MRHPWRRLSASACALAALAPCVAAQDGARDRAVDAPGRVRVTEHRRNLSWALFAAADRDRDDRLDVFEAARTFPDLSFPLGDAGTRVFRAIDDDRNGYVSWNEFDARYRDVLGATGTFEVVLARRAVEPEDPTRRPETGPGVDAIRGSLEARLAARIDTDGNGKVDVRELARLLKAANIGADPKSVLAALDKAGTGAVPVAELLPVVLQLRLDKLLMPAPLAGAASTTLPEDVRPADVDGNGVLDRGELSQSLAALDPALARHTDRILADADTNRSRTLGLRELSGAGEPRGR